MHQRGFEELLGVGGAVDGAGELVYGLEVLESLAERSVKPEPEVQTDAQQHPEDECQHHETPLDHVTHRCPLRRWEGR